MILQEALPTMMQLLNQKEGQRKTMKEEISNVINEIRLTYPTPLCILTQNSNIQMEMMENQFSQFSVAEEEEDPERM